MTNSLYILYSLVILISQESRRVYVTDMLGLCDALLKAFLYREVRIFFQILTVCVWCLCDYKGAGLLSVIERSQSSGHNKLLQTVNNQMGGTGYRSHLQEHSCYSKFPSHNMTRHGKAYYIHYYKRTIEPSQCHIGVLQRSKESTISITISTSINNVGQIQVHL